ncbi:class I SAM-dependent methyltransferase [Nocardia yunnanensis]|uniref:Class I SAM-dependent methyltransferase n=1 Tax=Nocardia yunnanensis TaxID=2382165 RepID=A0A386ZQX9_9NOCA|nr:class I SAM-dependent methyltransferase [Nocardia yunnanensis]AYF79604.1 class I SAM-dependent methyltransferase [Nocardia yunnanensis]
MTESPRASSNGLFAGTAWHYARYRPNYPQPFFDDLVERFHLDGTGRLLDLGCGTGQLAIPLAAHVAEAVGMDPEPEMLVEAARCAQAARVTNVFWEQGGSADLPGEFGRFQMVVMGRSFHWMDRKHALMALDAMIEKNGAVVLANDSCLVRPTTTWQKSVEDIQHRYLPTELASADPLPGRVSSAVDYQTHEQVLSHSPFSQVVRSVYEFDRPWTTEQVIGYLYSTSLPLRQLLGDRRAEFEQDVADTLRAVEPDGLIEPVKLEVLTATRP